jgi:hypothetical protein
MITPFIVRSILMIATYTVGFSATFFGMRQCVNLPPEVFIFGITFLNATIIFQNYNDYQQIFGLVQSLRETLNEIESTPIA